MVKVLSRDAVQRMTGRKSSSAVNIGGGSGDASGVSRAWVEENYISKAFFETLFTIHGTKEEDGVTTDVVITPNDTETTLNNIQALVGLWTNSYLSALGLNPGGGGGGGATALTELVDVAISNPQNGQALIYNSTAGKWVNGQAASGSVTSVSMSVPTGFSVIGSPITSAGTLVISFASGYSLPTTAKQNQWDAKQDAISDLATIRANAANGQIAYGWGNHANAGYATKQWVTDKGYITSSALTGYATQSWVTGTALNGYAKLTDNVASATKLQTARTIWGQNFDGTGNVSGAITGATTISASSNVSVGGTLGVTGATTLSSTLGVSGLLTANGGINIPSGKTLTIGDAVLSWDSTNQGIKITKGLYSETFISALGANSSGGGGGATALTELVDVTISNPQNGQALIYNSTAGKWVNGQAAAGSVTSVAMSVPTGFSISGSPITTSGTLALSFASGYSLPTTAKQTQWDAKQDAINDLATIRSNASHGETAYNWGNHANADYATRQWVQQGYLPLTGGTMANTTLVTNLNADMLDGRHGDGYAMIGVLGTIIEQETDLNDILHAGTYTCISSAEASTLVNTPYTGGNFRLWHIVNTGTDGSASGQWSSQIMLTPNEARMFIRSHNTSSFGTWKEFAYLTSNVASATKLQTARTIWGQNFDGTGNVSGAITGATTISASSNVSVGGTLGVTGATTLSSTLGVTGLLTANGGINIPSGKTLTIANTTLVTNLNADMLDGRHGDGYAVIGVMGTRIEQETDLNDILNAGTYTCISGADALTLSNTPYTGGNFRLWHIVNTGTDGNTGQQWSSQIMLAPNDARMFIRSHGGSSFGEWKEFAYLTSNVASATKLQTARTIWGQNFDGTGNVSGDITDAGNIFAKGDYLLLSSGKSKYGLMVESTSWGENRDCAFGFHAATSGHDIAWSTRSGQNDICLDLVIDPNNTVAKRYTRVYDALCIGDGMIVWDSANNALKVIKINGDAANFYATGGVSALGIS